MASALHGIFDIRPASNVASPEPTYQKSKGKAPQSLRDVGVLPEVELEDFTPGKRQHDEQSTTPGAGKDVKSPRTPNELEMSRPPTPRMDDAVGTMRTWNSPPMTKWRISCCCLIYFSNGISDSGTSSL